MPKQFKAFLALAFPAINVYARSFPVWAELLIFAGLTGLFSLAGRYFPADGFVGFDWVHFWGIDRVPPFYPPWVKPIIQPMTWPLLTGITMAAFSFATFKRYRRPSSAIAAFFCLPFFWTIFLGQLEGMVLMGLLWLPWLAPFALMKPQVSIFAFGARRSSIIGFFVLLLVSIIIWGPWPFQTLNVESFYAEGRYQQNIGLGLWGLPLTLATLWFSRGDMDMLMASGVFMVPHLIPYNLLPLSPAIARLKPRDAAIAAVLSWLPLSSNWVGPYGWWLGWVFVGWLWFRLACLRYPHMNVMLRGLLTRRHKAESQTVQG